MRSYSDGFDEATKSCAKQVPEQREPPLSQVAAKKQTKGGGSAAIKVSFLTIN